MRREAQLEAAIKANPNDPELREVYADWFEERGMIACAAEQRRLASDLRSMHRAVFLGGPFDRTVRQVHFLAPTFEFPIPTQDRVGLLSPLPITRSPIEKVTYRLAEYMVAESVEAIRRGMACLGPYQKVAAYVGPAPFVGWSPHFSLLALLAEDQRETTPYFASTDQFPEGHLWFVGDNRIPGSVLCKGIAADALIGNLQDWCNRYNRTVTVRWDNDGRLQRVSPETGK